MFTKCSFKIAIITLGNELTINQDEDGSTETVWLAEYNYQYNDTEIKENVIKDFNVAR